MKKYILTPLLFFYTVFAFGQNELPASSTVSVKKIVKLNGKWYIETNITTKIYTEVNTEMLLGVERDSEDAERDISEVNRAEKLRKEKLAERVERNNLLKEAIKKGYNPEVRTLEEKEKIENIKKKVLKL